jgi:hypothetical protein
MLRAVLFKDRVRLDRIKQSEPRYAYDRLQRWLIIVWQKQ